MENTILHESGAHRAVEIHGLVHDNLTKKNRIFNPLLLSIWIHMFLGLQDPDPLVRGMDPDPDPSIIMQKSLKNDVNVPSKSNKEKKLLKH